MSFITFCTEEYVILNNKSFDDWDAVDLLLVSFKAFLEDVLSLDDTNIR